MKAVLWPIGSEQFAPHELHRSNRSWTEANCYVDLWVEILHALKLDPVAGLAFTLATDFEGDQWTFFKFPLGDLFRLYGLDVQELNIWRSMVDHILEQVSLGRLVVMETDSFFLPNVAGTGYRTDHHKTTIGVQVIDRAARRLGYFHHGGYYTLHGDDFDGVFRLAAYSLDGQSLPLYVEVVKLDALKQLAEDELTAAAIELTRSHLTHRPSSNPFARYRQQFRKDLAWLQAQDLKTFHEYAYATLRQCGACYEYAGVFLRWLERRGQANLEQAAVDFDRIAECARTLMLKTARAMNSKKDFDFDPLIGSMEAAWDSAMDRLVTQYDA